MIHEILIFHVRSAKIGDLSALNEIPALDIQRREEALLRIHAKVEEAAAVAAAAAAAAPVPEQGITRDQVNADDEPEKKDKARKGGDGGGNSGGGQPQ